MGKTKITIRLATHKREALDAIAAVLSCDRSDVLYEAIDAYLDTHRWQIEHIKKGLKQAKSGQFASEREIVCALKGKGTNTSWVNSEPANDAVRQYPAGDEDDLKSFQERAAEPNLAFKAVLKHLKRHGR